MDADAEILALKQRLKQTTNRLDAMCAHISPAPEVPPEPEKPPTPPPEEPPEPVVPPEELQRMQEDQEFRREEAELKVKSHRLMQIFSPGPMAAAVVFHVLGWVATWDSLGAPFDNPAWLMWCLDSWAHTACVAKAKASHLPSTTSTQGLAIPSPKAPQLQALALLLPHLPSSLGNT